VYIPEKPLKFKNNLHQVYQCREETKALKRYMYYPVPPLLFLSGLVIYKTIFFTGYLWITLPTIPIGMLWTSRQTVIENMEASIDAIWLEKSGTAIRVKDMSGRTVRHPIDTLRRATD
jgi:hypothetical protein